MRTVLWRLSAWDPDIASVRYRATLPAFHLAAHGVKSNVSAGDYGVLDPVRPDVVVFVKAFGDLDVELAHDASRAGVPVVLDVCDNVFAVGYGAHSSDNLNRMAKIAEAVVTTGSALADVLRRELGDAVPLHVVPDPVETPEGVRGSTRLVLHTRLQRAVRERRADVPRALAAIAIREVVPPLRRAVRRFRSSTELPQVLWFGNSGSIEPRFGIVNVVDVADQLDAAAREAPFRLLIVTDDESAYKRFIKPLALDTRFAHWDRVTIFSRIRESAVVIVPNSRDEFSLCKSANRPSLALDQGVPVVATRIPSLDVLEGAVLFDDFYTGVVTYLRDAEQAATHVRRAREIVQRQFAPAVVADAWANVFETVYRR